MKNKKATMTEDLDTRLAALQARRGQPSSTPPTPRRTAMADQAEDGGGESQPGPATTTARPKPSAKRTTNHAAPATRILALGLSASAAIALTGIMARAAASPGAPAEPSTGATAEPAPAAVVVHVVLPNGQVVQGTQTPTAAPVITAARPAAQPAPRTTTSPTVVTRSRAS